MSADLIKRTEYRCIKCMRSLSAPGAVCSCGYDNSNRSNGPGLLRPGLLKNQYFTGKMIGRGGFGVTYIGYDMLHDRRVAVKEYFPEELVSRSRSTGRVRIKDPEQDYQFQLGKEKALKEVRTLIQLRDMENIVKVYEAVQENDTVYIIMEYIDGMALDDYVKRRGRMKPAQAFSYIRDVISAVAKMQERFSLSHGDISPDNIMLRSRRGGGWTPVLVDFGAMQKVQEEAGTVEAKVAKQYYSAPELLNTNGKVNKTTDGFSLCATLYFLLAGEISRTTIDRYIEELPSLRNLGVNIGPALQEAIMKGMALKIENRYEDAQKLLNALLAAVKKDKKARPEWGMELSEEKEDKKPVDKNKRKKDIKNLPNHGTNGVKPKSKSHLLITIAILAALVAAAAVVVFTVLPSGGKEVEKPLLSFTDKSEGLVCSWDIEGALKYDVCLKSSDGSLPVRYSNTRVRNILLPREDLSSGLKIELEVTAYFEDGSTNTVSQSYDVG